MPDTGRCPQFRTLQRAPLRSVPPLDTVGSDVAPRRRRAGRRFRALGGVWVAVAAVIGAGQAAGAITPVPPSVSMYPTQTSGPVTLNMTFAPPTWSGTSTINFTSSGMLLPAWLVTVPSPVTFSFAAGSTSATATFRFQAGAAAVPGTFTVSMAAIGGPPPSTIGGGTITVQILQPSFTASAAPNPVSIPWGGSRSVTVSTAADPGYANPIQYTFSGFPAGITWGGAQTVNSPYPPAVFTFSVAQGTTPGTYTGSLLRGAAPPTASPMTVVVQPPDIAASFSQPSMTVCNGGPAVSNGLGLLPVNGYVGTPAVASIAVPAGLTVTPVSLAAAAMPPGQTIPFTVSAVSAAPGIQFVTFRVTDPTAGVDKTVQLAVNVTAPDFTPAVAPPSLTLVPGGASQSLVASLAPNACFSAATVTITPSGTPAGVTFAPPAATLSGPAYAPAALAFQAGPGAAQGTYPITLTFQASSGGTKSLPVTLMVVAAPDFTLAVAPLTLSLAPGSLSAVTVSAAGINGFSGPIAVTAPTLPGVTFVPAAFTLSPGGSQSVAVQAVAGAAPAAATAVFTGTATGIPGPRTVSFLLTITAPPDFALSVNPTIVSVAAGTSATVTVAAAGLHGFAGTITVLSPTLANVSFAPASFTLVPGGSQAVVVQVAAGAAAGDVPAVFAGTAPGAAAPRTAMLTLRITPAPDFVLAVNPGTLVLTGAAAGNVTVSVTGLSGFAGTVTVAAPMVPGVAFVPASFPLSSGASRVVAVQVGALAAVGSYAVQFTGTAAGVSGARAASLIVTVAPAPPVIHAVTPPSLAAGTANTLLRVAGEHFRPGATVSSADPALQVLRTTVLSSTAAEVLASLRPGGRLGPYRLDLANADGTRTSQGVVVLVYPTTSLAAPLGVTTAAIVFPRPFTLLATGSPVFPRGLLATTGLGTIVGSWRYDGIPFDQFTVNAAGGMPVEVKAHVPIPTSYTGEHKLELAIERPQVLVTDPVSVIQALESRSQLEILAPPGDTVFGETAPLFRWSLVPGASGYEIEIERQDIPSPLKVRLSESEWRPSPRDVEAIGAGAHRFRVRAIFPGETSGEPTPWRRFVVPPRNAELRMLGPASDPRTGRAVVRWEGGSPGLIYRLEFLPTDENEPFAVALTAAQRYPVPAGLTHGGVLRVRVVALAPDGSVRGTAAATEVRVQSSRAAPGREFVLASLGAQVTAMAPPDGATVGETRPRIEVRWSGSVAPAEVLLTVDATDVTAVAVLKEGSIAYASVEPLSAGAHVVRVALAGNVTRATFTVAPTAQDEAPTPVPPDAPRRDWQVGIMGSGTETSDQETVHGDAGRLQLTGQSDLASGAFQVKGAGDIGGRRDFEPPYSTVSESRNWQLQLGANQEGYRQEARIGYSPPDFLDQSEFLAAGLARGGAEATLATPAGSISYYQTFGADSAGATGAPSLAQDIKGIGIQAPWDPTRFLLRAVVLRNESEVDPENAGVRGEAAGVLGRFVLGPGLTLLVEGAYGKVTPQGPEGPPKQGGYALHLGASGALGTFVYALNLRKTDAEFANPANLGLTAGAVPDRIGGDLSLSKQFGAAMVSVQFRRLESGGGADAQGPKASENGAMVNLALPLRTKVNLALAGTWAATDGEADTANFLPAVSRTQRGMTLTLTEVPGRLVFSQALSWQEMRDDYMPAADQTVKSAALSANGSVTPALMLAALASFTRSEGAPAAGRTDQLMLSLQPTLTWTRRFLSVSPRAAYIEVRNDVSAMKTTTDQYQVLVQLTPPWAGSLVAFQVAADWNRSRSNLQSPAPGFYRRIVGTCTLRWNAQREADATPVAPLPQAVGAGWNGHPRPIVAGAVL